MKTRTDKFFNFILNILKFLFVTSLVLLIVFFVQYFFLNKDNLTGEEILSMSNELSVEEVNKLLEEEADRPSYEAVSFVLNRYKMLYIKDDALADYKKGDLVFITKTDFDKIKEGDDIFFAFTSKAYPIKRVSSVHEDEKGKFVKLHTKKGSDDNELYKIHKNKYIGKVRLHLPFYVFIAIFIIFNLMIAFIFTKLRKKEIDLYKESITHHLESNDS